MTNLCTGAAANDGFSITQHNNEVTIRQFEAADLHIFGYNGIGLGITTYGKIGNGTTPNNA
jgi:hypothetical protein